MDELLDYTEKTPYETGPVGPVTAPIAKPELLEIEPLTTDRAADGTRTKVHAAPPPIPARARGGNTMPPPIANTATADDDIPMTVEPAITRRAGTIPPPIPAAARRPPTVPPVDAPSIVVAPSVVAPMPEPVAAAVELSADSWSVPPSDSAEMAPIVEPIAAPLAVRPSAVAKAAPLLGIAPPTSTLLGVTITPATPAPVVPPVVASPIVVEPVPEPIVPAPVIAASGGPEASGEVSTSTNLPPLPAPSPSWLAPPEWPARTSSQLIRPRAVTSRPVPRPSEPPPLAPLEIDDEEITPTTYFERTEGPKPWNLKLVAGIGLGAIALVSIIALALRGGGDHTPAPAPTPAHSQALAAATPETPSDTQPPAHKASHAAATPTTTTTTAPAPAHVATSPTTAGTTAKAAAMVEIPISSWPAGATVTLVDDGTAKIIGHTPMTASVDPSRSYDIVLAVSGRPTTVRHIDPNTTHELSVDLDPDPAAPTKHTAAKPIATTEPVAKPKSTPKPAIAVTTTTTKAPAPATKAPAPTTTKQVAAAPPKAPTRAREIDSVAIASAPEISGTLMISSKPSCEILVDGKATRLSTPQNALALSPGAHAITLVNTQANIKKTIAVHIEAKRSTKVAQDFTAQ